MRTPLSDVFGIDLPIFAFSHCREVVAAVSRAGGLGVLGALAFSPEQLEIELYWIDEHVDGKPYGVDVVMPAKLRGAASGDSDEGGRSSRCPAGTPHWVDAAAGPLRRAEAPRGVRADGAARLAETAAASQVRSRSSTRSSCSSNALGPPPKDVIDRAHEHGVKVAALVRQRAQAQKQVDAGRRHDRRPGLARPAVTPATSRAWCCSRRWSTRCAGAGARRRRDRLRATGRRRIALGAQGVWTGSIWLTVAEAEASPVLTEKLLRASSRDTVRTRSMTGKPACCARPGRRPGTARNRRGPCRCRCSSCSTRMRRRGSVTTRAPSDPARASWSASRSDRSWVA